eukprot:Opistho-2@80244
MGTETDAKTAENVPVTEAGEVAPLSFDEKYQLSIDICKLPQTELTEIVGIIRECMPTYRLKHGAAGTVDKNTSSTVHAEEIDVNLLDDVTLRRIQQYIRTSLVEFGALRIVIMDSPKQNNIDSYIEQVFKKYNVQDVVRVCDAHYSLAPVAAQGIAVHDWKFKDGEIPSAEIINNWIDLITDRFASAKENAGKNPDAPKHSVAVHCAAGLGRAPVLACIALIEVGNMENDAAVELLRSLRPGAINKTQLEFVLDYKRRGKRSWLSRTVRKIFN